MKVWITMENHVKACIEIAEKIGKNDFAGKWVIEKVQGWDKPWLPGGLKRLVKYGILEPKETSRRGRRRYYSLINLEETKKALQELGV